MTLLLNENINFDFGINLLHLFKLFEVYFLYFYTLTCFLYIKYIFRKININTLFFWHLFLF